MNPDIFRAYDIRGVVGQDFEIEEFYSVAQAYARVFQPGTVAVGHDVRRTSPAVWQQVAEGLTDAGVDVLNIGAISTDMLYFAVVNYRADGGLVISASHNPRDYNGMKMVREEAIPISGDSGIMDVRDETMKLLESGRQVAGRRGVIRSVDLLGDYLQHLRTFADVAAFKPKKLVLNANCGYAGLVARRLLEGTPVEFEEVFFEPDGDFAQIPAGRPDPLRPENQAVTTEAVRRAGADFAAAWDADADRCFFFDERGDFVDGPYVTARLADILLRRAGGGSVVYDPRVIWAVEEAIAGAGGAGAVHKSGHSFIKERMRQEDAIFGGEASAHYYFRRNFYTDNGMAPFLLVLEDLCESGVAMSEWVRDLRERHPMSGEINFKFADMAQVPAAIGAVDAEFDNWGEHEVEPPIDGTSARFFGPGRAPLWRLNVRVSNTEPVLRLNVEAIEDEPVMRTMTETIAGLLEQAGGTRDTPYRWE